MCNASAVKSEDFVCLFACLFICLFLVVVFFVDDFGRADRNLDNVTCTHREGRKMEGMREGVKGRGGSGRGGVSE